MNLGEYKHVFESAWIQFMNTLYDHHEDINTLVYVDFASNTYVFQFQLQRGRHIIHTENQQIQIGDIPYSIEHIFMRQEHVFYLYSFFCSCSHGLVEGHLQSVYFNQEIIYDYSDNLRRLETLQLSTEELHMDFLTDDPLFFPMGIIETYSKRKREEKEEDYNQPSRLVFKQFNL